MLPAKTLLLGFSDRTQLLYLLPQLSELCYLLWGSLLECIYFMMGMQPIIFGKYDIQLRQCVLKKSLKSSPGPGVGVRRSSARCPPPVTRTSKRSSGSEGRAAPFCSTMASVTFCSKSRSTGDPLVSPSLCWSSPGSSSPQNPLVSPCWSSLPSSAPWSPLVSPSPC